MICVSQHCLALRASQTYGDKPNTIPVKGSRISKGLTSRWRAGVPSWETRTRAKGPHFIQVPSLQSRSDSYILKTTQPLDAGHPFSWDWVVRGTGGDALFCVFEMMRVSKGDWWWRLASDRERSRHSEKMLNQIFIKFIGLDCWDPKILLNFRVSC